MPRKKKIDAIDFPVFSIIGTDLEEEIEQAVSLKNEMNELSALIEASNKTLLQIGSKLNLYINNVIKRKQSFNFINEFIIFSDEQEISIFPHEVMDDILDSEDETGHYLEEEEIFQMLPETNDRHKLNKKQIAKCSEIVENYNMLYEDYENTIMEMEDCHDLYQCIIDETKKYLSGVTMFDIKGCDNKTELEPFDDNKHDLLIIKDTDTKKYKFIYLRKNDRDKFIEMISGRTSK